MEKVIKDGKVAVLYSPGFGAGWYTWNNNHPELLFHPKIVEMVEQEKTKEIDEDWIKNNLGLENVYCGGASSLKIKWLFKGTHFDIDEYDGAESIKTFDDIKLIA
jgi:hypothetical protein